MRSYHSKYYCPMKCTKIITPSMSELSMRIMCFISLSSAGLYYVYYLQHYSIMYAIPSLSLFHVSGTASVCPRYHNGLSSDTRQSSHFSQYCHVLYLYLDKRRGVQENIIMRLREFLRVQPERTPKTECWYFLVLPELSQGTNIILFLKVMYSTVHAR